MASHDALAKWGVSFYEALEVARQNLAQRPAQIGRIGDGLYVLATADATGAPTASVQLHPECPTEALCDETVLEKAPTNVGRLHVNVRGDAV